MKDRLSMSEQTKIYSVCPYLGLTQDPHSHFSKPDTSHCCLATEKKASISLEHQSAFCLSTQHPNCPRFKELSSKEPLGSSSTTPVVASGEGKPPSRKVVPWALIGLLAILLVVFSITYFKDSSGQSEVTDTADKIVVIPSAITPTATHTVTASATRDKNSTYSSGVFLATPTSIATPVPGYETFTLSPARNQIGWLTSGEDRGNHFGDSYLYAGTFEEQVYSGAFQFDLSTIPRGASIRKASVQLTGLRDDRLGRKRDQPNAAGGWSLRLLAPEIDLNWSRHDYQTVFNADVLQTLNPILGEKDLAVGQVNSFELSPAQIKILEKLIVENENPTVSFRVDGPLVGADSLFAWDTGYGPESQGNNVILSLEVGKPPATPPPYNYVVVTSTPTPENVVTAAAIALNLTAEATRVGTATPIPSNMVTATPIPDYLVVVPTATPENLVTAQALAAIATAQSLTTGTPTPVSTLAVTATPIPTETPTPVPPPIDYVIITSTPTPESVIKAATMSAVTTAQARNFGTPTPLPYTWATPVVVTATPTPLNAATAQFVSLEATAIAYTTGTPTSTPSNVVTATPTPVYEYVPLTVTPTALPFDVTPQAVPSVLVGKILFKSDREGPETNNIYLYDPDSGELGRLTDSWPYQFAQERNTFSADTAHRAYTKQLQWVEEGRLAIHVYDYEYQQEKIVTKMGAGIVYDPAWSPTSNQIAFVATETGNDEIWVVNSDGTEIRQLTRNEWEWDKSPSWSPDGKQIVFSSNRTGNQQLWIMNPDGSDQRLLLGWDNWTPYNDWAPVWVSYSVTAPPEHQIR